jgi:hypothetical protein
LGNGVTERSEINEGLLDTWWIERWLIIGNIERTHLDQLDIVVYWILQRKQITPYGIYQGWIPRWL